MSTGVGLVLASMMTAPLTRTPTGRISAAHVAKDLTLTGMAGGAVAVGCSNC